MLLYNSTILLFILMTPKISCSSMFLLLFFPQQSQEDNQVDSWDLHCYDCLYPTPLTAVALDLLPGDKWTNGTSMERCNFAEVVSKEDMLHGYKYFIFVFWLTFLYFFFKRIIKNQKVLNILIQLFIGHLKGTSPGYIFFSPLHLPTFYFSILNVISSIINY